jgi:hypothetical protein
MKKLLLNSAICLSAFTTAAFAADYPSNPVVRPLTLNQSTVELSAAYGYGKNHNNSTNAGFGGNISYGLTDNFQIGLDGLTYSAIKDKNLGFELAVNAGLRGYFDSKNDDFGDSTGLGIGATAKQIISDNFAFTAGVNYTHWDIEKAADRYELDYSVGFISNISDDLSLSANYTLRDLKDFEQGHANAATVGLLYTAIDNVDLGLTLIYSDFSEKLNGYEFQETPERAAMVHATWRF